MKKFEVGEVVLLKSGSPDMTVVDIVGKGNTFDMSMSYTAYGFSKGFIICQWFEGETIKKDGFPPEALTRKEAKTD